MKQTRTLAEAEVLLELVGGARSQDFVVIASTSTTIAASIKRVQVDEGKASATVGDAVVAVWLLVADAELLVPII